ncbi:MAG: D-alanyl-D-alanine carboxypeptidase family protein [Thermodesulfobacteriota bacterium]
MMIRPFRNLWMFFLFLIIISVVFPNFVLAKTSKTSKESRPPQTQQTRQTQQTQATAQGGLRCDAQSAVLMDALSGQILFEQNPNARIPPASFGKILTLYLALDAIRAGQLKMDDMVTVSEKAWRMQGSKMFIKVGERVKVEDLLKGIAISSGNDACIALAEHMAGSEEAFVSKMNEKAALIGMKDSQFKNSHGMPAEGQYTTATDMALLARHYIQDHPEALAYHSTTEYEYNKIRQYNRNTLLLKNIGVDGLKTGHVEEAGFHLLATAKRDGQRLIAVVMGCDKIRKRAQEAQALLEYGFKNFSTVEAVKQGAAFGPVNVRRGKERKILLVAAEEGWVTVPKGKENVLSVNPELPRFLEAPIQKNQVLAKVLIQNEGKVLREINLIAPLEVQKSLLPPWPVLVAVAFGILMGLLIGLWRIRMRRTRPRPLR